MTPAQGQYIKKLEWAIGLSQVDLGSLREGDWLNLRQELYDFLLPGPLRHVRNSSPNKASKETIAEVQSKLRDHLKIIAQVKRREIGQKRPLWEVLEETPLIKITLSGEMCVFGSSSSSFTQRLLHQDLKNRIEYAFITHLLASGITASQIRACPVCSRIFLIKRRPRTDLQFHCSLKCSRLAATRRYRKNKAVELRTKERERSRRRYVEKQRRKYGPKVMVARRPRQAR